MEVPLKQKLAEDLKESLRARDTVKCGTIRLLISAIKNTEIARQETLDDIAVFGVIAKEIKQRDESIEAFKKGSRPDLVAKEEAEKAVLLSYLPKQMSRDEIAVVAKSIIAEVGAKGVQDKGKVMHRIIAELKGKADGREINAVVSELLAQGS